jgi:glucosamine--fructose-6-phosphate aminotransferase (isomerizing)
MNIDKGCYTRQEILSQPEAWADALETIENVRHVLEPILRSDYNQVLFTGCGSTYYLSLSAAALFQELTGKLARAVPGGELLLNGQIFLTAGKTLLVAVSRSGSTTETVRAVSQFKQLKRGPVVAITNYGDQPLAGLADVAIIIEQGQEESVAQTRSFASMFVAATALAAMAAGDESLLMEINNLPEAGRKLLAKYEPLARKFGENLNCDRFYFLGSGIRYGLACEANLKMKEMTLTHSEPFRFLEFRHGPMSMVTENAVVVGLLSGKNFSQERAVLNEMQAKGANILSLAEMGAEIAFGSGIPESGRAVLYLPVLQLMAFYRSLAKGLDPDHPNNLTAVVFLEQL